MFCWSCEINNVHLQTCQIQCSLILFLLCCNLRISAARNVVVDFCFSLKDSLHQSLAKLCLYMVDSPFSPIFYIWLGPNLNFKGQQYTTINTNILFVLPLGVLWRPLRYSTNSSKLPDVVEFIAETIGMFTN